LGLQKDLLRLRLPDLTWNDCWKHPISDARHPIFAGKMGSILSVDFSFFNIKIN
jgi:hypothetical protein